MPPWTPLQSGPTGEGAPQVPVRSFPLNIGSGGKSVETTEDMDKRIELGKINTKTNGRFVKKFHLDNPDEILIGGLMPI
jgi:hypothetical protein